jgi:hypothetical protein
MIILYRNSECPGCESIQKVLQEMHLAHRVVVAGEEEPPEQLPSDVEPPALVDNGEVFQGREAVMQHLEELESFQKLWYEFGSDACYCEEDGEIA